MKLNIGSGNAPMSDCINVDFREDVPGLNVVCDLKDPLPFRSDAFEFGFAHDVLEHFPRADTAHRLADWMRVCKMLQVRVPDLEFIAKKLVEHLLPDDTLIELIYGGQEYRGNTHLSGFTVKTLDAALRQVGCHAVINLGITHHNRTVIGVK